MPSSQEYSQRMRALLKLLDPDISADPITVERKIIDTVAETLSEADVDTFVLNYQLDVDTKVGSDLDKFVGLFGFARQGGRRATGTVTFSRTTPSSADIVIAAGTQVIKPTTSVSTQAIFFTTSTVVLTAGATSVEAPVEAGSIGLLGNVPAGTITQLGTTLGDISEVLNENATSGGSNEETDAELRVRFKNTIFRNVTGTADQYLALAIANRFSNKANVIGPISRYIEYAQVPAGLTITSLIPYSKFTYDFDYYVTNGDLTNEVFFTPRGVDYTFGDTVPPTISVVDTTSLPEGTVVLFEHSYCSNNSRNDPANNKTNYVDIYISGQNAINATESTYFPDSSQDFVASPSTSAYYTGSFVRVSSGIVPSAGNRFQEVLWQPLVSLPSAITIGGVDYFEGTHYWLVRDTTTYKGSRRSRDGIEWAASVAGAITAGTTFSITYSFDKLPLVVNELIDSHKQITTDVLVHKATNRFFNVNVIAMYVPGFSKDSVDTAISTALTSFFNSLRFGAIIQISDILEVIHEVPGVDNVRLALPADGVAYGIQEVAEDGVTPIGAPNVADFTLQDSDLPVLNTLAATQRSQNTWGS